MPLDFLQCFAHVVNAEQKKVRLLVCDFTSLAEVVNKLLEFEVHYFDLRENASRMLSRSIASAITSK